MQKFKIKEITDVTFIKPAQKEHIEKQKKWEYVSKEQFLQFLSKYPNSLSGDFYMDWYSYNDFTNGKVWPESMVAMESHIYDIDTYKIWNGEYIENFVPASEKEILCYWDKINTASIDSAIFKS